MGYKYIYNEQGQKEAVIIPISEWENLTNKEEKKGNKIRLSDMIGTTKGNFNSIKEVDDHLNKLRDEWD
jgi:PHD/YefM family antitoxin component YafN of YafNO toxin-antitoxin module